MPGFRMRRSEAEASDAMPERQRSPARAALRWPPYREKPSPPEIRRCHKGNYVEIKVPHQFNLTHHELPPANRYPAIVKISTTIDMIASAQSWSLGKGGGGITG